MTQLSALAIGFGAGIAVGALLAWLPTRDRTRLSFQDGLKEAEIRTAAAESSATELRRQIEHRDSELDV